MNKLELIAKLINFAESQQTEEKLLREHLEVNYCEWFEAGMYSAIIKIMNSKKEIFDKNDFLDYAKYASKY